MEYKKPNVALFLVVMFGLFGAHRFYVNDRLGAISIILFTGVFQVAYLFAAERFLVVIGITLVAVWVYETFSIITRVHNYNKLYNLTPK